MLRKIIPAGLVFICVVLVTTAVAEAPDFSDTAFFQLADEYFDNVLLPDNPSLATQLGVHIYDDKLEDYSPAGIARKIATLKQYEKKVAAFSPVHLSQQAQGDYALLLNHIRSQLLSLQQIRAWEKDPDFYSSSITNGAFVIMERPFASANERLKALIAREQQMPAVLQAARQNLKNPPKIYTEIALEQLPSLVKFFKQDVPAAFTQADDATLKKAFSASNAAVVQALIEYQAWVKKHLLPNSHGDFRIGADNFRKKLQYDEMVDLPLDQLLAIGMTDLHKNQAAYQQLAKEIDPQTVLANHPSSNKVLSAFTDTFDELIAFIKAKNIITIPSPVRPIMEETPPFLRATTFASMDTPGPFEKTAKEAYFNATLPDPNWSKQKTNEYLGSFNYSLITITSIHETYPGHYVQFLWMHEVNDKVRKILGANTNAEGWAHYCEQMLLDEGYGVPGVGVKTEREAKALRLSQLQDALMRDARFIVGIQMHTGKMTIAEAMDFYVREGYQSRSTAIIETKRGTSDPTYLYYTLGKLQILKLRADVEAKEGAAFNLQKFHDDFMRQGYPPIKIVREAMLGEHSATL